MKLDSEFFAKTGRYRQNSESDPKKIIKRDTFAGWY